MEKLFDKLSLHELLSMIIPGSYVLLEIGARFNLLIPGYMIGQESKCGYFIFFVAAYIIGLIVDTVAALFFLPLRNHPYPLKYYKKGTTRETECDGNTILYAFAAVIVTILSFASFLCDVANWMWLALLIIICCIAVFTKYVASDYSDVIEDYYSKYYYLQQIGKMGTISRIEGQVAFLRNMFFSLILFQFIFNCCSNNRCLLLTLVDVVPQCPCLVCLHGLLSASALFAMILRQHKVYYIVNTDYQFYSMLPTNEMKSTKYYNIIQIQPWKKH